MLDQLFGHVPIAIFQWSATDGYQDSLLDLLLMPILLTFFGLMIYIANVRSERVTDKPVKWWWWSLVLLGLAALMGLDPVMWLRDLMYRNTVVTGKSLYGHYFGLAFPLVVIIGCLLHRRKVKSALSRRVY